MREALRLHPSRGQFVVAALLLVLGFALAVQVQSTQDLTLSNARSSDLVRILDDLGEQRVRLNAEASGLESTLRELQTGADQAGAARAAARDRLETLGILAGTVPAEGPGVTLTVADPLGEIMAADLLDAVQELRDAGAEAIQIDDIRVVGSTSFIDSPDGVVIDGQVVSSPYTISAIGDSATLASALAIPGGVIESMTEAGARPAVVQSDAIKVDALKAAPEG
ncbi:MAG TPA: DUF881 domain-containing protein [Actinomycetes bacterium]|nr:DUF881 domain-containing protein [Actinomycetes bacterium]